MSHKAVRELMFCMEHASELIFSITGNFVGVIAVWEVQPEQGVKAALGEESLPEDLALTQLVSEVTTNPGPAIEL
jgi:hypothetical protein